MSANAIAAIVLGVPFVLIYPRVILREEEHLERLFPVEFRKYKMMVPRFFPRLVREHLRFSSNQYLANGEYNTAVGMVAAVALFAIKSWIE
jgi:hypothetical protein